MSRPGCDRSGAGCVDAAPVVPAAVTARDSPLPGADASVRTGVRAGCRASLWIASRWTVLLLTTIPTFASASRIASSVQPLNLYAVGAGLARAAAWRALGDQGRRPLGSQELVCVTHALRSRSATSETAGTSSPRGCRLAFYVDQRCGPASVRLRRRARLRGRPREPLAGYAPHLAPFSDWRCDSGAGLAFTAWASRSCTRIRSAAILVSEPRNASTC